MTSAKVAIVGGGVAGCSLAFHLARLGCDDVVLLEQNELTSGSTWHAAGLCTQWSASWNLMRLLRESVELYRELEAETPVGWHETGSLRLACDADRLDDFHHHAGIAATAGVPLELVPPERAAELHPLVDPAGVLAAAWIPTDGHVDPTSLTNAYAAAATARGARILRRRPVTGLARREGAWDVETPQGRIRAELVVNAAGQWAREVGRLAGCELPIVPLQHHYVVTDAVPEVRTLERELPVLRDPDGSFYVRQEGDGLIVGPFERAPLTWALDGIPPGFHSSLLPADLDRIEDVLVAAAERVPAFGSAGIRTALNGPDGYTPDGRCLMGPVPGLRGFHVLAGFSIFGIVFSGGAGRYAAEWILDGQPSETMWELDVSRFGEYARSTRYVARRACEVYEREYAIRFPHEERPAGRPLRTGPLYDRLLAKGAVYGVRSGWERPLHFGPAGRDSFRRSEWHGAVAAECAAVRDAVGVLDQTSFAKFDVSGPGAQAWLDRLCANALPAREGRVALTQLLTERGGIECDVTVTRLPDGRFYVVSAAATQAHDRAWLERHLPADGSVRLDDATAARAVLTLAGPRSRDLLARASGADVSRAAFPFFSARELEVGMAPALALRVSYVGELGYELHLPAELARHAYDVLWEAGRDLGLADFGYRALESMRLEKAYRLWGADMSAAYTPLEAGLERFVALDKGEFVGREALLAQRARGLERTLACLVVDADGADAHGFEPIYDGGGPPLAYVASGGYGHRVGRSIALAYLPLAHAAPETRLAVEILGERRPARVVAAPLYDPGNARLLS